MDQYQQFIHKSRYARWLEAKGRRETWEETVQRYVDFWTERKQIDEETAVEYPIWFLSTQKFTNLFTVSSQVSRRPSSASQRAYLLLCINC